MSSSATRAGRSHPRRRPLTAADLLCAVVLLAVAARLALPSLWRVPTVQAWTLVFGAVCVQAAPYVVLGVALSAALALVPDRRLRRLLPRSAALAVPVAAALGVALPGCECGSVPLAAGLLRRGVPAGPAVSLMLSAPATNPVVLAATAAAFPGRPGVVAARFTASLAVAVGAGWWTSLARVPQPSAAPAACAHEHRPGLRALGASVAHDLAQSLGLLTVGAASAAGVGVLVPPSDLDVFTRTALGGVLALAVLAVVLAVCSEADAFIASSLTQFSTTAQLAFMVVGPVVDLKLLAMQAGAFGARFHRPPRDRGVPARRRVRRAGRAGGAVAGVTAPRTRRVSSHPARSMTPRLQAGVLVLFGAALSRLASGEQLARYVRPGTRPLVLAAGVVLVVIGTAVAFLGRSVTGDDEVPDILGATPREAAVTRAAWLLLGPVVTIAVVAPPALGVLTADRPPVAPPRPSAGFVTLPPGDPTPVALSDVVLRTVWHAGSTLRGRTLRVIGFVARPARRGFVLARLVITCCAADARPYDIAVTGARAPPAGTWVAVTGRYLGAGAAGPIVPAMQASAVVAVAAPADPYG